jgi:hypothetical protein
MFTREGQETVDPAEAQYMWVNDPNIMIAIDPMDGTIRFEKSDTLPLEKIDKLRKQLRKLANDNALNFQFKIIGGEITPKDYSAETKRQEKTMESIILEGFSKLRGSTKTSYQMLENARLVIKHRLPVNEEIRGARSRNIQAIFIESNGERFRFPVNNLAGARAALRHVVEGGKIDDQIGNYIVESTKKLIKMREFVRYARTNKLINEDTAEAVDLVKENIQVIASEIHKITGKKTYESIKTRIEESNNEVLEENDIDELKDMFTIKRFDEKFLDLLPDVKQMVSERQSFLRRIEEASEQEIKLDETKYVSDTIIEHTTREGELSSRLQMVAASIMENEELASYVSSLAGKLVEGELNAFESSVLGNVLRNAKIQESVDADLLDFARQYCQMSGIDIHLPGVTEEERIKCAQEFIDRTGVSSADELEAYIEGQESYVAAMMQDIFQSAGDDRMFGEAVQDMEHFDLGQMKDRIRSMSDEELSGWIGHQPPEDAVGGRYFMKIVGHELKKRGLDEGYTVLPQMSDEDQARYQERDGLEGPFRARSGKVYYYDPSEGKYYDPDTDFYISDEEFMKHDQYGLTQEGFGDFVKGMARKGVNALDRKAVDQIFKAIDMTGSWLMVASEISDLDEKKKANMLRSMRDFCEHNPDDMRCDTLKKMIQFIEPEMKEAQQLEESLNKFDPKFLF